MSDDQLVMHMKNLGISDYEIDNNFQREKNVLNSTRNMPKISEISSRNSDISKSTPKLNQKQYSRKILKFLEINKNKQETIL